MDRRGWTRSWIGLALVALSASTCFGSGGTWADGLFAERQHDFGPVPRGAIVRHPFVLSNATGGPVTIVNLRVSCGCTSGKATVPVIPAGQSGVVEAQMDTRNFVGRKATTLFVTVNNGSQDVEVPLNVASTILSDIVLNPGGVDFGQVARGHSPTLSLTIDRVGQPDWRVVKMVSGSKVLNASLTETARSAAMVSYRLDVSIKPTAGSGPIRDEIQFLSNDRESRGFPVLVAATVQGDLTATPSVLSLAAASAQAPAVGRYIVRSSRPFKVDRVDGTGQGFTAKVDSAEARPLHVVTLAYLAEPGQPAPAPTRSFQIVTDLPGEPPAVVTATLQGAR